MQLLHTLPAPLFLHGQKSGFLVMRVIYEEQLTIDGKRNVHKVPVDCITKAGTG